MAASLNMQMVIYNAPTTGTTLTVTGTMMTQGVWNPPAPNYGDQINYGGVPYQCSATQPDINKGGLIGDLYLQFIGTDSSLSIKFNLQQASNTVTLNGKPNKVVLKNNITCYVTSELLNNVLTVNVGVGSPPPSMK